MEIIYVDSDSNDNSIVLVESLCDRILKISGNINAAVARNTGAENAEGEVLFFIDGDMEIVPEFYKHAFIAGKMKYPFLSGIFINNYFDKNGKYLYSQEYKRSKPKQNEDFQVTTGGLFIVSSELWKLNGGMDSKFTTGEDLDFGLRLSNKGFRLLRLNKLLAYHNTVHYNNRIELLSKKEVFARAILYRNHLFNFYVYKELMFRDPTLAITPFLLISAFLLDQIPLLLIYPVLVLSKSCLVNRKSPIKIPYYFIYQVLRDAMNLLAFLLFYPQKKSKFSVEVVK